MKIGIIDYRAGNVRSVEFALNRIGYRSQLSSDPDFLSTCDKLIFPGVGHAKHAMEKLKLSGLDKFIQETKKPLLGICLGMQLLCNHSEEGNTNCLGIFNANVKKFTDTSLKVPHTGWNTVSELKGELFDGIQAQTRFYFVHSYYAELIAETSSRCEYGIAFSAALQQDNYFAVQFHPEKSGIEGEKVLRNFLQI